MTTDYNIVDIVFITSALIIIGIASFRGLIKEVFSLISWAAAFLASYLLSGIVAKLFAQHSTLNIAIIEIITRSVIFTIVFLVMIFSTSGLAKEITSYFSPALNNFLGVIFGAFKTLLIFGLLYATYLTINQIMTGTKIASNKNDKTPKIISSAKTGGIIKYSGELLQPIVYGFIGSIYNNYSGSLSGKNQEIAPLLHLIQNNYNIGELQQELENNKNLNPDSTNSNIDDYRNNLQKLQEKLNNNTQTNEDQGNAKNEEQNQQNQQINTQQNNQAPSEEKGYNQQDIKKKDYIIKVIKN